MKSKMRIILELQTQQCEELLEETCGTEDNGWFYGQLQQILDNFDQQNPKDAKDN